MVIPVVVPVSVLGRDSRVTRGSNPDSTDDGPVGSGKSVIDRNPFLSLTVSRTLS